MNGSNASLPKPGSPRRAGAAGFGAVAVNDDILQDLDEYGQDEIDDLEDLVVTGATTAETVEQLGLEVVTLKALEGQALGVLHSGRDAKWAQLDRILDDPLMVDTDGNRRKLIVFTEPKDTLHYLRDKIQARLGNPDAVAVIHGGVTREERRKVIERFMQDRDLLVLVANDAAGEGVEPSARPFDGQLRSALEPEQDRAALRAHSPHRADRGLPPVESGRRRYPRG